MTPRVDTAPQSLHRRLMADWLGLMEPEGRESYPLGRRRGLSAPGEDIFLSPDQISFHIFKTTTLQGRNGDPPDSYHPARCGNSTPIR